MPSSHVSRKARSISGSAREVGVFAVLHVALADEGLEVAAVADAVGWVEVDHLHLAGHPLLLQQAVNHQERVAGHEPIAPAARVLVELDRLAAREVCRGSIILLRGDGLSN